ncbi:HU family DNA-binding protein [Seleniivibrio woodruffii]|uniref:Nucleoid protein Hbs n=1 Tax=Seleniivibrio woodruffii TaxID=1078050 RepID=A0A4R1K8D3_9BACT|nr:HU family DNA-binding protein [Seleniivibrio woodruffii]TCK60572.1 nucleoid protein Hbs [Seleniivibrio woodruffii]TVZ36201.1 DNA-binding protein HU-beta [Seleniivibrio woodruffii]
MNKKELIEKIAELSGLKKSDAEKALKAFEEATVEALKANDKVTLVGFGTFSVSERKERKGRNPQSGKEMTIPSKKVPKFTAGKLFKDSIG